MEFKKNNTVILRIEDMSQDGLGIGKAEGYALFVKDTVIGDLAKVKILKTKKNYGFCQAGGAAGGFRQADRTKVSTGPALRRLPAADDEI